MTQAKTLTAVEIERLLTHITKRKYAARNRSMMLLTHWAGLRIGEVACLRWSDVTTTDGQVKDEIRLLPDLTKGRHARTVFVSAKLKTELQAYAAQAKCVERSYPFFASQKSDGQGRGIMRRSTKLPEMVTEASDIRCIRVGTTSTGCETPSDSSYIANSSFVV